MRIVSRLTEEESQFHRLRMILDAASDGEISENGPIEPGKTLPELITQVDNVCINFLEQIESLEESYEVVRQEARALFAQVDAQDTMIQRLVEGVQYDEALDYATVDLMDAILGSGAANTTFNGDLSFEDSVVLNKEDIKPMLRQAIETWINMKVR